MRDPGQPAEDIFERARRREQDNADLQWTLEEEERTDRHGPDPYWRARIIEARNARLAEMAADDTAPDRELTRAELAELALPGWLRNEAAPASDREGSATNQEVKS